MREVTSASNIYRRKLCPGSANAEEQIIDSSSEAADDGTLLHPFAENKELARDHLSETHRALLLRFDLHNEEFMAMLRNEWDGSEIVKYPRVRLFIQDVNGDRMFSGENDIAMYCPDRKSVAIEDAKMGFVTVTKASENWQICAYGIMWADYLQAESVIVAINQPRAKEPLTVARYSRAQLEQARLQITAIFVASQQPDAPRIAGEEQCRFCKAKVFCEEYRRKFEPLTLKPDAQTIAQLEKDTLLRLFEACRFADRIGEQVKAEVSRRIAEGDPEFAEWELAETGNMRQIDVIGAYQELSRFFDGNEQFNGAKFTACTKVNISALTELVKELSGLNESRAKKLLGSLIEAHTTWVPKKPTPRLKG